MSGLIFSQSALASEQAKITQSRDLWLGFASEHSSSAISSFGHTFLCLSKADRSLSPFDPTVMVAVGKAELKFSISSQTASVKHASFDSLVREYVEKQGRSLTLFRLKLSSLEVARVEQLIEDIEIEPLPYKFLSRNCTHYCIDIISRAHGDLRNKNHSRLYITPRSGVRHLLAKVGSDRVLIVRRDPKAKLAEATEHFCKPDDYDPIQLSGIGPLFAVGAGVTSRVGFYSMAFRLGVHELTSDEQDDFASKMLFCEANLELAQRFRTALTLFDFEVFRNTRIEDPQLSKLFRAGFDDRVSFQESQRGIYAKYAILLSKGNDRLLRFAVGPEVYLSSRDFFNLRTIACARLVVQRAVFIDSRVTLQEIGRPFYEVNVLAPMKSDLRFRIETRVGEKQWTAGVSVGYLLN